MWLQPSSISILVILGLLYYMDTLSLADPWKTVYICLGLLGIPASLLLFT